ncbi:MAG: hypothetical protein ABSE99_00405 [Terracidiphilus sp.]
MKKLLFAILLLAPALAWAEKPAPSPADYTIAVHVQASRLTVDCGDVTNGTSICRWTQHLSVLIDGKKYELNSSIKNADLLRVGDYKAKLLKEETKRAYEYMRNYEFLFPDGTTRDYYLAGETE